MGITTRTDLTTAWVQIAPASQRLIIQRSIGQIYFRYSATEPDPEDDESLRSIDSEPREWYNDTALWARAQGVGSITTTNIPAMTGSELPAGSSTEAKQDNAIALLQTLVDNQGDGDLSLVSIDGKVSTEAKQDAILGGLGDILTSLGLTKTVNLGTLNGASTEAKQDAIVVLLDSINDVLGGTLTVSLGLTDTQLRATPVPVAQNDAATSTKQELIRLLLDAINTKLGGTLTVNVGLTDAQLRATAVTVTQAGVATEAKQDSANTLLTAIDTGIGTDGAAPPVIVGTGIRGWLRSLWDKLPSLISGMSQAISMDYGLAVSRGLIAGVATKSLTGYNAATPTTLEPVWSTSAGTYSFPTGASTVTVSSSSASDSAAGTGVRTISVNYLRTDFTEVTVPVTMNGTTPVTVATDVYRINSVTATSFGSVGSAVGTIPLVVGANVLSRIEIGESVSQQLIYTVPVNKVFEALAFRPTLSAPARFRFQYRPNGFTGFITAFNLPLGSSQAFTSPFASVFPAGTDIIVQAQSLGGTIQTGMIISGFLRSV